MLKHATICRTKRAHQAQARQWDSQNPGVETEDGRPQPNLFDLAAVLGKTSTTIPPEEDANNNMQDRFASLINGNWLASARAAINHSATSCSSSPTPSLQSTPMSRIGSLSSAPPSVFNSPSKSKPPSPSAVTRYSSDSMIKIYAQKLSQEVEYMTVPVNAQTKSREIIRSLLRKFRLKHRDPNLFYLILERWIRKDGLRSKSVMVLGDEACPLQLQQCCSNPPHNDIKFTLDTRPGALVKIFCQDVSPETKYKCLSLSTQTTVEETIELMLHCLNLSGSADIKKNTGNVNRSSSSVGITGHLRQASSPSSTDSSSSSASTTSSSSGIDSDPTNNLINFSATTSNMNDITSSRQLDSNSRASSVTSISSISNLSNTSSSQLYTELYCLVIECKDTNYTRILEFEEYLVEAYQNLLDELCEQPSPPSSSLTSAVNSANMTRSTSSVSALGPLNQQPDQWFVIKLRKRDELSHQSIKFTNPRQNMPLPPIPLSLAQMSNANNLQHFVSTTQIEVNHHRQRPFSSLAITSTSTSKSTVDTIDGSFSRQPTSSETTGQLRPVNCHQRQMSAIVSSNKSEQQMKPPPAHLVWMPQVKPRRRNLSNASSTFGRPHTSSTTGIACNRRRYDPAQLAEDLNQLNLPSDNQNDGTVENRTLLVEQAQYLDGIGQVNAKGGDSPELAPVIKPGASDTPS